MACSQASDAVLMIVAGWPYSSDASTPETEAGTR